MPLDFATLIAEDREQNQSTEWTGTFLQYLELVRNDPHITKLAHSRLFDAITRAGSYSILKTDDPRTKTIYKHEENLNVYNFFANEFFGIERTIAQIVRYFHSAALKGEESRQVLYFMGPVGSGKSSLVEKVKRGLEMMPPVYGLKGCPLHEEPLHLVPKQLRERFNRELSVVIEGELCPVCRYRLDNVYEKRFEDFEITTREFSVGRRWGVGVVPPVDPNNQDTSVLVGSEDISKLDKYSEGDPRVLELNGALNVGNRGLVEFIEVFKNETEYLHAMITATQEKSVPAPGRHGMIYVDECILAHCFSEDTEILTNLGWRKIDELTTDELAVTLDTEAPTCGDVDDCLNYEPVVKKWVYDHNGDMYALRASDADHLVTPNHKMIYVSDNNGKRNNGYKTVEAKDFFITGAWLPVSGYLKRGESPIYNNADELRFHVWCVTDGSLVYERKDGRLNYNFHLKKSRKVERFHALLERLQFQFDFSISMRTEPDGAISYSVNGVDSKFTKMLNNTHRMLGQHQTEVLLEEWSHTDGSRTEFKNDNYLGSNNSYQLFTNVPFHRDLIQELATISGYKSTCAVAEKCDYDDVFALWIRPNVTHVRSDQINQGSTHYKGRVWCIETPSHTVVARRNGKILITKNSNEAEWTKFKSDHTNEAILDRIVVVKVPYNLRLSEEVKIYQKIIRNSDFRAHIAPHTIELASMFAILSRLESTQKCEPMTKLKIYNGEEVIEKGKAKRIDISELTEDTKREGMDGISTRFIMKSLDNALSEHVQDRCINPIYWREAAIAMIKGSDLADDKRKAYLSFLTDTLHKEYLETLEKEITKAFVFAYVDQCEQLFQNYLDHAEAFVHKTKLKDRNTKEDLNPDETFLKSIEEQIGIIGSSAEAFRQEVIAHMWTASRREQKISYKVYEPLKEAIEKKLMSSVREISRIVTKAKTRDKEQSEKYDAMVKNMLDNGYCDSCVDVILKYAANNLWKD